jgi:threonine synthase
VRAQAAGRSTELTDYAPVLAQPTLASAIRIGAPVSLPKALAALARTRGLVEHASETELAEAAARADRTGLFCCPHTGVALACLEKLVARGTIARHEEVVVVSTAHGLKFTEFKTRYHEGLLEFPSKHANRPVPIDADPKGVGDAIRRALDARASSLRA